MVCGSTSIKVKTKQEEQMLKQAIFVMLNFFAVMAFT